MSIALTVLVWIGVWTVASILFGAIWIALHRPRRAVEPAPATTCAVCGPTDAAIYDKGLCWKCAPVVRKVHADYEREVA